jgi:glucose/mannose-6-phosphate isomerase
MHVITEDVIEVCHNGIVSWGKPSDVKPILIQGVDDYNKTKERFDILMEYFELNSIEYKKINSVKGSILTKLINLIYFLDYTSIYKAILLETNPTPVKSIEFVKKRTT